jgi:SAM-dependent methyltransferase
MGSLRVLRATSRVRTIVANRILPARHECPCCGWRGRRFNAYIQEARHARLRNEECPICQSHRRHRFLALWLRKDLDVSRRRGTALVFAPEQGLWSLWQDATELYVVGVDREPKARVSLVADLCNLPMRDDCADLVWCHHVLEHIERDRDALRELYRVLRPVDGELVLSVPMRGGPTVEYGFADPRDNGHWRHYGDDFVDRLEAAGLETATIKLQLEPEIVRRYRLSSPRFFRCRKR